MSQLSGDGLLKVSNGIYIGTSDGRAYTKVIKMVRSEKTGAYIFDERMVPNEAVKGFFKK